MITALAKDVTRTEEYLKSMNIVERMVVKNDKLVSKLKLSPNSGKSHVINEHLSNQRHFGPRYILIRSLYCVIVGVSIGTTMSLMNLNNFSDLVETGCDFNAYIPLYVLAALIILLSFFICKGMRNVNDPYFLKWEFVLVIKILIPSSTLFNVILLLTPAIQYHGISTLIMIVGSHFVSIVVPNVIAFEQNRKIKIKKSVSISSPNISGLDLRKRAAERFCVELVFFKEDYELFKVLQDKNDIEIAFMNIISKYFEKNTPQELSISESLKKQVMSQFQLKEYAILDEVYQEVKTTLFQNISLD